MLRVDVCRASQASGRGARLVPFVQAQDARNGILSFAIRASLPTSNSGESGVFPQYTDVSTKLLVRMRQVDKIHCIRNITLVQQPTDLAQEPNWQAFKRENCDVDVRCLSSFPFCPRPEEKDAGLALTKAGYDYLPHSIKI